MRHDGESASMNRDDDWTPLLENRVVLGKAWRDRLVDHKRLADTGRYIRILGKSVRAISIDHKNPCGSLLYSNTTRQDGARKEVGSTKTIEKAKACEIVQRAIDDASPDISETGSGELKKKPELRIQASLIREALLHDLRFDHLFKDFKFTFDELFFVTDELSLNHGKVRADMVAVGGLNGAYFPVLIELKKDRLFDRLEKQLNNAQSILNEDKAKRDVFDDFLCAVSGVDKIDRSKPILRMLIWPKSESGKEDERVATARRKDLLMANYFPKDFPDGKFEFKLDAPVSMP